VCENEMLTNLRRQSKNSGKTEALLPKILPWMFL